MTFGRTTGPDDQAGPLSGDGLPVLLAGHFAAASGCLDAVLAQPAWARTGEQAAAVARELLVLRARVDACLGVVTAGVAEQQQCWPGQTRAWLQCQSPAPLPRREARAACARGEARVLLPELTALHDAGAVSTAYLDAAVRGLDRLPPETAEVLDRALAEAAPQLSARLVARLVSLVRQSAGLDDHDPTREGPDDPAASEVWLDRYGSDDRYSLRGHLGTLDGAQLEAMLTRLSAPTGPTDRRTPAQRRAAALVHLTRLAAMAEGTADVPGVVPPHGLDAHLVVFASTDTLRREPGAPAPVTEDGATVTGWQFDTLACTSSITPIITDTIKAGPVPHRPPAAAGATAAGAAGGATAAGAGVADGGSADSAESSADSDWAQLRRAFAGLAPVPLGDRAEPLYVGRAARTATRAQWLALLLRDRTCRYPGCDRGPRWCQAHHLAEWDADGGRTDLDNLILLCWEHHRSLHRRALHLTPVGDGTYTLTHEAPAPPRPAAASA